VGEDAQPREIGRTRSSGASIGPVRPSTISSAAMSPISRCSTMCATSSFSESTPSGVLSAQISTTMPPP
jgi:hypothetical protein